MRSCLLSMGCSSGLTVMLTFVGYPSGCVDTQLNPRGASPRHELSQAHELGDGWGLSDLDDIDVDQGHDYDIS